MLGWALTTADTFASTRDSAATRSRSTWSMIAMSPGFSRPASRFVRRSNRATPVTPESPSTRLRRSVASFIGFHGATEGGLPSRRHAVRLVPTRITPGLAIARSGAVVAEVSGRRRQQFGRVLPGGLGIASGEHPGQLRDAVGTVDDADGADPAVGAVLGLVDDDVLIGICRNLRQVGDDDHLIVPRQPG